MTCLAEVTKTRPTNLLSLLLVESTVEFVLLYLLLSFQRLST